MQRSVRQAAKGIDAWLTLAVLALLCIGVIMVYSASVASSYVNDGSPYYIIQREIVWVVIGFTAFLAATQVDYLRWQQIALPFFAASLGLLLLVLMPHFGHSSHGAQRWFSLGFGVSVEPSEIMKLAAVVYMAAWLTSKGDRITDFKATFFPFSLIVGLIALLVVKQPDLGTTIVLSVSMFAVFFLAGGNLSHIGMLGAGASFVAWTLAHSSSYRLDRLTAFMDPWRDQYGTGYHIVQALLALGAGGVFGVGLGNSVEKHVLPAPYTDSIMAVIGEEWGLVGTLVIVGLFVLVACRGIQISIAAPDMFGRLLAAGITSWITLQALLNVAVITSSVPFTGVPLPFISYGGTSLIITMAASGILLNISRHATGEGFARTGTDYRRGHRRARLSGAVSRPVASDGSGRRIARPAPGRNPISGSRVRPTS
jgi:cell division protein FtsW